MFRGFRFKLGYLRNRLMNEGRKERNRRITAGNGKKGIKERDKSLIRKGFNEV
jgi:hypothetical protein